MFANARNLCFKSGSFDIAICGFMGWDDCFDFIRLKFTQPDTKAAEIRRVLREGGKFICCSWEEQEDLAWMREAMQKYYPILLQDGEYQKQGTVGMSQEKAQGYEIILRQAGFREIEFSREIAEFISTDEEEWWQQMRNIGWDVFFEKISQDSAENMQRIKDAIFEDLQSCKRSDGICFTKTAFYVSGVK